MSDRAYLNVERGHIETILGLFVEVTHRRPLSASEKYVKMILTEALDRIDNSW